MNDHDRDAPDAGPNWTLDDLPSAAAELPDFSDVGAPVPAAVVDACAMAINTALDANTIAQASDITSTAIATAFGTLLGGLRRRGLLDEDAEAELWARLRREQAAFADGARQQFGHVIDHVQLASGIAPGMVSWAVH